MQVLSSKSHFNQPEQIRMLPTVTLKKELISHPLLQDKFQSQRDQLLDQGYLFVSTLDKERQTVSFKNPFDIPRNRLIQQVSLLFVKVIKRQFY